MCLANNDQHEETCHFSFRITCKKSSGKELQTVYSQTIKHTWHSSYQFEHQNSPGFWSPLQFQFWSRQYFQFWSPLYFEFGSPLYFPLWSPLYFEFWSPLYFPFQVWSIDETQTLTSDVIIKEDNCESIIWNLHIAYPLALVCRDNSILDLYQLVNIFILLKLGSEYLVVWKQNIGGRVS